MKGSNLLSVLLLLLAFRGAAFCGEVETPSPPSPQTALAYPNPSSGGQVSSATPSREPAPQPLAASVVGVLHDRIAGILNRKTLRSTEWSVLIQDLDGNQTVFASNPSVNLIPASNRKLFTTALALDRLGPDFRFTTGLYLDGEKAFGKRFNGDLVVIARGDPTFCARWSETGRADERFREWADFILERDIDHIRNVVIDISGFPPSEKYPEGWKDDQLDRSYSAPVSAFSFNENVVTVNVEPGAGPGSACRVSLEPAEGDFRIVNETRTVEGSGSTIVASRPGNENAIEVRGRLGRCAATRSMVVAVADPPPFAGDAVVKALESRGVNVAGTWQIRETPFQPTSQTLTLPGSQSPPLSEIVKVVNQDSNNFMAEHLYKAVALHVAGDGSYEAARQVEDEFLKKAGIAPQDVSFVDGCGLSHLNRVNSETIVKLLRYMSRHPYAAAFEESLSISGETGVLRHRLGERQTRGKLHAKTGFIKGVSALSGYLDCPDGTRLVLSIIGNFSGGAYTRIEAQDDICREILRQPLLRQESRAHGTRSSKAGRAEVGRTGNRRTGVEVTNYSPR